MYINNYFTKVNSLHFTIMSLNTVFFKFNYRPSQSSIYLLNLDMQFGTFKLGTSYKKLNISVITLTNRAQ